MWPSFQPILIRFTYIQDYIITNLGEIGPVVLENKFLNVLY